MDEDWTWVLWSGQSADLDRGAAVGVLEAQCLRGWAKWCACGVETGLEAKKLVSPVISDTINKVCHIGF